jgi:hypothetical protein
VDTPLPPVQYKTDSKVKVGGKAVITEAECKIMFSGVGSAGEPVSGQETVKLKAKKTTLLKQLLVTGDQQISPYGNKLQVIAIGKLTTS